MSDAQTIETILTEERRYPPPAEFAAQANAQPDIYEQRLRGVLGGARGASASRWFEPFTELYSGSCPTRSGTSAGS